MTLSMCSSRYCSSFAPLFLLFFGLSLFFWDISTFSFYFFDIFSSLRSTKEVTTENMSIKKWKTWPVEISEDVLKIDKKTWDHEKRILWPVFDQFKIFQPRQHGGCTDPKKNFGSIHRLVCQSRRFLFWSKSGHKILFSWSQGFCRFWSSFLKIPHAASFTCLSSYFLWLLILCS